MADDVQVAHRRFDASDNEALIGMARMGAHAFGYTADLRIDRGLAQLLRLRVSQLNNCSYCLNLHYQAAREAGIPRAKIDTLTAWWETELHSEAERAALRYTEALTRAADTDRDAAFQRFHDALVEHFGPEEMLEIVGVVVNMNVWTRIKLAEGAMPGPRIEQLRQPPTSIWWAMYSASSLTQPRSVEPRVCCQVSPGQHRPGQPVTPTVVSPASTEWAWSCTPCRRRSAGGLEPTSVSRDHPVGQLRLLRHRDEPVLPKHQNGSWPSSRLRRTTIGQSSVAIGGAACTRRPRPSWLGGGLAVWQLPARRAGSGRCSRSGSAGGSPGARARPPRTGRPR